MTLNPSNPLKITLINFQSIREKKPQFFSLVDFYKPDILVGTETRLTPDMYDSEYFPPELGFTVYRRDRTDQKGGGVIILVNSNFISEEKTEYKSACENLWVQLNLTGSNSVLIGAYYKPHKLDQLSSEELNKSLHLVNQTNSTVWLLGDFNLPKVDWEHLKSRKENPQKLTQLSSRSHPRHLVGKRTAQKDITIDTTSDSQVNSNFPNRWSPARLTFNNYFYLFLYLYIT